MITYKQAIVLAACITLTYILALPKIRSPYSLAKRLSVAFPYDRETAFPAHIWQTWKTSPLDKDFDRSLFAAQASWADLNPDFDHNVVNDAAAASLVHDLYVKIPEIYQAYNALPKAVLKADFFRYLILLAQGGVYSDIDTTALKPNSQWVSSEIPTSSYGIVIGIEADPDRPDWQDWYARRIQFCQWTIQSKPGHPILIDIVTKITEETLHRKMLGELDKTHMKSVMEFTGPGVWTDAVLWFLNNTSAGGEITWHKFANLSEPMQVADVVVLPITSFSPGVGHMGSKSLGDPMAFVGHAFKGSWKENQE